MSCRPTASIPSPISVGVLLIRVGGRGTVVLTIRDPVAVPVGATRLEIAKGPADDSSQESTERGAERGTCGPVRVADGSTGGRTQNRPDRGAVDEPRGRTPGRDQEQNRDDQPQPPDSPQLGQT